MLYMCTSLLIKEQKKLKKNGEYPFINFFRSWRVFRKLAGLPKDLKPVKELLKLLTCQKMSKEEIEKLLSLP
jgi:hypothetical protein